MAAPPRDHKTQYSVRSYTIGWFAPLPCERAVAEALRDEIHGPPADFERAPDDHLVYSWGKMGTHNFVLASLEAGTDGLVAAAQTATRMLASFPYIRFSLLVGIGGAIPRFDRTADNFRLRSDPDVRLGDIVVSQPDGSGGGVIQYDHYKATKDGSQMKGSLNRPPPALLYGLSALQAGHEQSPSIVPNIIATLEEKNDYMVNKRGYKHPGQKKDRLFYPSYAHPEGHLNCETCSESEQHLVKRGPRSSDPKVHYGTIASGSVVVKNAEDRENLIRHHPSGSNCLCYEMEAAGLMNNFPCLVIRGICDYSDSHKNDVWRNYAALVAAAFAKELLLNMARHEVEKEIMATDRMKDRVNMIARDTMKSEIERILKTTNTYSKNAEIKSTLQSVNLDIKEAGQWFLDSSDFQRWNNSCDSLLWVYGLAGSGKTVLSASVFNYLQNNLSPENVSKVVLHYYFDFQELKKGENLRPLGCMLRSFLIQLSRTHYDMLKDLYKRLLDFEGELCESKLGEMLFQMTASHSDVKIVIDALDEIEDRQRETVCEWITETLKLYPDRFSLFVTSRRERDIEEQLQLHRKCKSLEMSANRDIEKYVLARIKKYKLKRWSKESLRKMQDVLLKRANGMFRWVVCQLDQLLDHPQTEAFGDDEIDEVLRTLPQSLTDTYDRILERIPNGTRKKNAYRLLQILLFCQRPIRVLEANDFLSVDCSGFNVSKRLKDPLEVTRYCSSLVTVRQSYSKYGWSLRELYSGVNVDSSTEIVLAHSSVRDYFLFNRTPGQGQVDIFGQLEANKAIFNTCLHYIYFLSMQDAGSHIQSFDGKFPLAPYATDYLFEHASAARRDKETVNAVTTLFRNEHVFRTWVCRRSLHTACYFGAEALSHALMERVMKAFARYTAARYGLKDCLEALIGGESYYVCMIQSLYPPFGFWMTGDQPKGNTFLQIYRSIILDYSSSKTYQSISPLYVAAEWGHEDVVRMLIEAGFSIDEVGGPEGTALDVACRRDCLSVVEELLQDAKQRSTRTTWLEKALWQAVRTGSPQLVQVFLSHGFLTHGAQPSIESAIFDAALYGNTAVAQELLRHGRSLRPLADSPLPLSSTSTLSFPGWLSAWVRDVQWSKDEHFGKICGGPDNRAHLFSTALQAAAFEDHEEIVEALLKEGWNPNVTGGYFGTALQAAAARGSPRVVQRLLDAGADPNTTGGFFKTALHASLVTAFWTINYRHEDPTTRLTKDWYMNSLRKRCLDRYYDWANYETVVVALLKAGAQPYRRAQELRCALKLGNQEAALKIIENVVSGARQSAGDFHTVATLLRGEDGAYSAPLHDAISITTLLRGEDGVYSAPLHDAISQGFSRVVKVMIRNGAAIDVFDSRGRTPIHYAMRQNNQDVALMVIQTVAQQPNAVSLLKAKDSNGMTAVHYAAQNLRSSETMKHLLSAVEQAEILAECLDARRDGGRTALHCAMQQDNQDIALTVNQTVAQQPNVVSLLKAKDSNGMTAVHYAAQKRVPSKTMKHLLDAAEQAGILMECLDVRSNSGLTALDYTINHNNQDTAFVVIQTVVQRPGLVSVLQAKNSDGMAAIHRAAQLTGPSETMKHLLHAAKQAGILAECLNAQSNNRRTALHYAVHFASNETSSDMELLIDAAASAGILASYVNVRDDCGLTALHCAASAHDFRSVTLLLRAGADEEAMNQDKQNFVDLARRGTQIRRIFDVCSEAAGPFCSSMEEARAIASATLLHQFVELNDVAAVKKVAEKATFHRSFFDISDAKHGMTLLHHATEKGYTAVGELLLDLGAQPEGVDKEAMTPLHRAAKSGCLEMVTAILQRIGNGEKADRPLFSVTDFREDDFDGFLTNRPSDREDLSGNTPLHYAVQNESIEMVKSLVHCGATMHRRNKDGNTALDVVQEKKEAFLAAKIHMPRDAAAVELIEEFLWEEDKKYDDIFWA